MNPKLFVETLGEHTVTMSAGEEPVAVLDDQAGQLLRFLKIPSTLEGLRARFFDWNDGALEQTIAVLLVAGILSSSPQVKRQSTTAKGETRTLAAWLHLTHQCNLSCRYCYVPRTDQRMDPPTAKRSVEAVYRSAVAHNCEQVRLKYAGGEPTLNLDALRAAQEHAERLSTQAGVGLETVVLTNGTLLTNDLLDFLLEHGIEVMVSLDGIGLYHDTQRPLKNQQGSSFGLVKDALDRLTERGISPHVSITITGQSIEGLPDLVAFLLDRELRFSFNFYREPDGLPVSEPLSFTSEQIVNGLFEAFQVIERQLPRHSLLSSLADRADLGFLHWHACGVGQSYLVIDSNGEISKCPMDMAHSVTTIDADDPLAFVRADTEGIQNLAVEEKECQECIWRYRCAGGCPRLTFQHTGRYNARSPLCEVYRAILPEVVRLEALRLIQYEEPWNFYNTDQ
ncbi:MAG: radical SAM protein [Chloroflexota bacterium]|nr:radical SAM protein [Chloroflexota bacterium]